MDEQLKQTDRVGALANRLRLLQVDFADQTEEVRREYLTEEVRRVLAIVPPNDRRAFLAELQERFPAWDDKIDIKPQPASTRPAFDEKELKDPAFLVARLVDICKTLSEAQRHAVTDQLAEAGLVRTGAQDWPQQELTDARAKLQLTESDNIDPGRALELMTQLAEFVLSLDQVSWRTWRALAPNSVHRRTAAMQTTLARFVIGDRAVGRDQLVTELKLLRQLTAALIGTLSQTGRIAIQHFRSISPDEIQVLVARGNEKLYWRKYVELAGSMDSGGIEDAIRSALATFAEALIQGAR